MEILKIRNRIALLSRCQGKENGNIIHKLQRRLRKFEGRDNNVCMH